MNLKSNCVQIMYFCGHKGDLVMRMAETCKCEEGLASEFINKYLHFFTEEKASENTVDNTEA